MPEREDTRPIKVEVRNLTKRFGDLLVPVSYTHLDVYKRQGQRSSLCTYPQTVFPL